MGRRIIGIHLLDEGLDGALELRCEKRPGREGRAGNAICVPKEQAALVTCPWCRGARTREEARLIVARMYAKESE